MKKSILAIMLAVFCLANIQAKDLAFYAPDDVVTIYFNGDNSIALINLFIGHQ